MSLTDHETPGLQCTTCGYRMDRTAKMGTGLGPQPGDVTLCMKCGWAMVFGDNMKLRDPTRRELARINKNPDVQRYRDAILQLDWSKK